MKYFPQKLIRPKNLVFLFFVTLISCAGRTTTNTNIKKISDALLETQEQKKIKEEKAPEPTKIPEQSTGPIPMATFMSAPTRSEIKSSNRWFPRVQSWAKIYRDIAKDEQKVRNYSLSAKYSVVALLWANRSLEIKDLNEEKAIIKIQLWVSQIKIPNISDEPTYFSGQDAYKKISETRKILDGLTQRFCLISQGVQFIPALAYFEVANDLLHQGKFDKSQIKIQNSAGVMSSIDKEKAACAATLQ